MPPIIDKLSLRVKVLAVFLVCCAALVAGGYVLTHKILLTTFTNLESDFAKSNVVRACNMIGGDLEKISSTAKDWAVWDDTYRFMRSGDSGYVKTNLENSAIANIRINLMLFVRQDGTLLYGKCLDIVTKEDRPLPDDIMSWFMVPRSIWHSDSAAGGGSAIVVSPQGPLLATAVPVLPSSGAGKPDGVLIMGRFLDSLEVARMAEELDLALRVKPASRERAGSTVDSLVKAYGTTPFNFVDFRSPDTVVGCAGMKTAGGSVPLVVSIAMQRTIMQKGRQSFTYLIVYVGIAELLFFALVWLLIETVIVRRLLNLEKELGSISGLDKRISPAGHDEIGRLAERVNGMLTQLDRSQHEIDRVKDLELQLSRAQKLETIGLLAGGVAHDLNNMLGPLVGYPGIMKRKLPAGDPLHRFIDTIEESARKAAAIVADLLTLARRVVVKEEVMALNTVVETLSRSPEFEKMVFYHPRVRYSQRLAADLHSMKGSPLHVSKAVMNLASNASESIGDAGTGEVMITTANRVLARDFEGFEKIPSGDYVVLTVSDTGSGIEEADLKKIFEPFYTKKTMGRSGTGLGMSIVLNVVKDNHGYVDITTKKDSGTSIDLYFPTCREAVPPPQPAVSPDQYAGSGQLVLVIDDVKEQRETVCAMLTELGYRSSAVSSGEEGVEFVKNQPYDLVVLDMVMDPGIDGLETLRRIRKVRGKQTVMIASGYAETERVREARILGASYLKKPYILEQLGCAVVAALRG
jgi:signal transduction histidine kinase/CheY-like chemotaxis protein